MIVFWVLLGLMVILESTVFPIAPTFVVLLLFTIYRKDKSVFAASFVAGLLLDLMLVRTPGLTAIFFLVVTFLILLYQRKYEIRSFPFVIVSSFAGSYLYLTFFGSGNLFVQAGINSIIAVSAFVVLRAAKFAI